MWSATHGNDDGEGDGCRLELLFFLLHLARSFGVERVGHAHSSHTCKCRILGVPNRVLLPLHGSGVAVGCCPDLADNGQVDSEQEWGLGDSHPTV